MYSEVLLYFLLKPYEYKIKNIIQQSESRALNEKLGKNWENCHLKQKRLPTKNAESPYYQWLGDKDSNLNWRSNSPF